MSAIEVDDFVDKVEAAFMTLTDENERLKAQVEALRSGEPGEQRPDQDLLNENEHLRATFLLELGGIWRQCARVLVPGRYMAIVVSDFRHGGQYYLYHADTAQTVQATAGLVLKGSIVLVQDNKNLYPYGIPYSFVPNVHHQMILIFQKPEDWSGPDSSDG